LPPALLHLEGPYQAWKLALGNWKFLLQEDPWMMMYQGTQEVLASREFRFQLPEWDKTEELQQTGVWQTGLKE
jgi:hypothetical protein